ncbi:PRC-barrel domain-containing protein [Roseovarius sp. SCSIO 43702]|uniref:PRC-barrel domain-containing protein n=1 Tax=Roseovarius sp. SCSIO 43702 TaxID=2823043 RepID=UPI001C72F615|nr:PRC-barrel domain-containing protein [Roseovarius sp. SCSIO 43702]QYX56095.1 PRC-barrel domain-containing protein [Roseovarius sp. SCSIO 43702]
MKRLLTTAATALVLSGGTAYAENHDAMGAYEYNAETDFYASDLIGMRVYSSEQEMAAETEIEAEATSEWDNIGEINDLIVNSEGEVQVAIIGVGGFLGIGEKNVALPMEQIKVLHEKGEGAGRFLVVNVSQEELENAPGVERERDGMENADTDGTVNAEPEAEQMAENAADDAEQTAENAEQNMENAAEEAEQSAENAADEAEQTAESAADEAEQTAENAEQNLESEAGTETAMDRPMLTRPNVEREGYAEVTKVEELTSDALVGQSVYGINDESVGEVGDLVLDENGKVQQAVINVGGFLGIGEKEIAVTFDELQILRGEGDDLRVYIDSTEEKLEAQPEFDG